MRPLTPYLPAALSYVLIVAACGSAQVSKPSLADNSDLELLRASEQRLESLEIELAATRDVLTSNEQRLILTERWLQLLLERLPPENTGGTARPQFDTAFVLDDLRFAPGSSELTAEARSQLEQLLERLALDDGDYFLEVRGHTDSAGEASLNLELGRQRAQAVQAFLLLDSGLPAHRVAAVTFGETVPLCGERNATDRARNRRVEVVVLRRR